MNDSTNSSPARRRKASRSRKAVVAAVLVAVAGATWYGVHTYLGKAGQESEYLYAPVEIGNIEDLVSATGTLEPRDYVDVGAQVSGQIEKINVEVGDTVKAGDKLASIDATTAKARVDANRAQMESSKTNLLTQQANLVKAERDFERQKNLLAEDATTKEQYLNAQTTLENARRSVETSKLQIEQQEANMRIEANNLKYTEIVAPIDGTVMSIAVKEGQTINASQSAPTVLRIANLNTMTVRTDVSEADVGKLKKGMSVYFTTLGSGSNRRYYGTLKRIEPTPKNQNSVVLYPVLFDVENEGGGLMPNMTAQVFFVVAQARNVLTVPMAALQQGQQIARKLAMKQQDGQQDGKAPAGAPAMPAAAPGGAATPAAAGGAAGGGSMPATAGAGPGGARAGGGAGGRPGGGFGGFNPQDMTPEQLEQLRQRMSARGGAGGAGGGFGGFGGGFGGPGAMGAGGGQQAARRNGTVMVKQADGSLEPRSVVIGVTDRVHGEVLEGLEEGEEVVIGTSDQQAAAPASSEQNNFDPRRGGFPGGGFRPF